MFRQLVYVVLMEEYTIYKITNLLNGKAYIGRTKHFEKRIKEHQRKNSPCTALRNSIQKNSWENFKVEKLEVVKGFERACVSEGVLMAQHNTLAPNGYNLITETQQGRNPSKETRERTSKANRLLPPRKGGSSIYKGVDTRSGFFRFRISTENGIITGFSDSEEIAAKNYDKLVLYFWGDKAYLNFPEESLKLDRSKICEFVKNLTEKKEPSSSHTGVSFHTLTRKWISYFYIKENNKYKQVHVGLFDSEEEAKKERDKAKNEHLKKNKVL